MSGIINFGIGITLADHFTGRLRGAENGVASFNTKLAALSTTASGIGSAMLGAFGDFTQKFAEVAQKQGDLLSLDMGSEGMEKLTQKAIAFSNTWSGVVAKDFIGASYDIKSGIASLSDEGVGEMTRYALLTAKATKASSEVMSKTFALGYGIFREEFDSDFDFGKKFSATISASVQKFRTDGADLASGLSTIGAVSQKMGVSLAETMAVLGVSKGAFNTASEGATSYRAFLSGAIGAQKKLGLSFVDSHKKLLPMTTILEKIKRKFGDLDAMEVGEIKRAFGSDEASKMILALIDKTDDLTQAQKELTQAQDEGVGYTKRMAQAREYGQAYGKIANQFSNLAYIIGKQLYPAMSWVSERFGEIIAKVVSFVGTHETIAQRIATAGVVFAGVATVLGTVGLTVATLRFGLSALGLSFGRVVALALPLGALLTGIGLAGIWVYQHWGEVSKAFMVFKVGVTKGLGSLTPFAQRIKKAFAPMFKLFSSFGKHLAKVWRSIALPPSLNLGSWGEKVGRALRVMGEIITVSLEGYTRLFNYTVQGWRNIFSWVPDGTFAESFSIMGGMIATSMEGWKKVASGVMAFIRGEISFDPSALLSSIWSGTTHIFAKSLDGWIAIFNYTWRVIREIIGWNPMDTIAPLWNKVTSFLEEALSKVTGVFEKITNMASFISSTISSGWDSVTNFSFLGEETKEYTPSFSFVGEETKESPTSHHIPQLHIPAIPTTILAEEERTTPVTHITEGDSSFVFNIQGDNPEEIAHRVRKIIEQEQREIRQRRIE